VAELKREFYSHLDAWQRLLLARHPQRPYTLDYARMLFEDFSEIHGDRLFADDPAIVCGMARFGGRSAMVIGQQKDATPRRVWRATSAKPSRGLPESAAGHAPGREI